MKGYMNLTKLLSDVWLLLIISQLTGACMRSVNTESQTAPATVDVPDLVTLDNCTAVEQYNASCKSGTCYVKQWPDHREVLCRCYSEYAGAECQILKPPKVFGSSYQTTVAVSVVVACVLFAAIVFIIIIVIKRTRESPQDIENERLRRVLSESRRAENGHIELTNGANNSVDIDNNEKTQLEMDKLLETTNNNERRGDV